MLLHNSNSSSNSSSNNNTGCKNCPLELPTRIFARIG